MATTSVERTLVDIQNIVAQLRQEASRIEKAIAALVGLGFPSARRGRPPKGSQGKPASGQKRRRMSAAARARIGAAKKAWWAKQKGKPEPKKANGGSNHKVISFGAFHLCFVLLPRVSAASFKKTRLSSSRLR